ncbi:hypothetical protein [Malaciobacter molluscorum]|nr:hypothetical protein [Malaciobacter molluscorum]
MKRLSPKQGFLYKHNQRMHNFLWKLYASVFILGLLIIALKGL